MSAGHGFGGQSMVAPLRRVLVRPPDDGFAVKDPERWHYRRSPDLQLARGQHEVLVKRIESYGAEVLIHDAALPRLADSVYVHDPVWITDAGALVLRMGKELRRGEEEPLAVCLQRAGVPIAKRLEGEARAEGGDLLWLDESTLVVGLGFRTNREGFAQLRGALEPLGVEVIAAHLPYGEGPEACLHLQSLISLVDRRTALVSKPQLPVPLYRLLHERGFTLIAAAEDELATLAVNVLALEPGLVIAVAGNPVTGSRLEAVGVEVWPLEGSEICLVAEGGPTCLTRPILRSAPAV